MKKGEGESRNLLLFFSFIYEPSNRLSSPVGWMEVEEQQMNKLEEHDETPSEPKWSVGDYVVLEDSLIGE